MKHKLLSLIVIVAISTSFVKAQWSQGVKWLLDSNYNSFDSNNQYNPFWAYPETLGSNIANSGFSNGYQIVKPLSTWPSSVDTNSNNSYLQFSFGGKPQIGNPQQGAYNNACYFFPQQIKISGYVNSIADSATFSVYILDTTKELYGIKNYNSFFYIGNVSIKSINPLSPDIDSLNIIYPFNNCSDQGVLILRLYPIKGDIININNVGVYGGGACLLPVSLISFNVQGFKTFNNINWLTATEINTSHFNIQRSTDGISFITIGSVNAKGASTYTFNDPLTIHDSRLTKLYYRLEIVDIDGSKTYSEIRSVSLTTDASGFTITPNPAKDIVYIAGKAMQQITIMDNAGRVVVNKHVNNIDNTSINIANLAKGVYFISVKDSEGKIQTEKLEVE